MLPPGRQRTERCSYWACNGPAERHRRDTGKELIALQRANGGWGQTEQLPSDAYATGETLYALHETGMLATQPAYRRGVEYLAHAAPRTARGKLKRAQPGFSPTSKAAFRMVTISGFPTARPRGPSSHSHSPHNKVGRRKSEGDMVRSVRSRSPWISGRMKERELRSVSPYHVDSGIGSQA